MNTIQAEFFKDIDSRSELFKVSDLLDHATRYPIAFSPWAAFSAVNVTADFAIAHAQDCLALKYYIQEPFSKATYFEPNAPVYKDSCVEFFIGFNGEPEYYNFEFNNAGTCLLGYGSGRQRSLLSPSLIHSIKYTRSFKSTGKDNLIHWELTLLIPFTALCFHQISSISGMQCKGNFFKCGDDLPVPHYYAWNNITSEIPEFHLPEFFGRIDFL
jgi:hypothetical protein